MTWKNILKDDEIDHYQRGGEIEDRLEEHYDEHRSYLNEGDPPTQGELVDELLTKRKNMQMGENIERILSRIDNGAKQREKALSEGGLKIRKLVREINEMHEEEFDLFKLSDESKKFYYEELEKLHLHVYMDLKRVIRQFLGD